MVWAVELALDWQNNWEHDPCTNDMKNNRVLWSVSATTLQHTVCIISIPGGDWQEYLAQDNPVVICPVQCFTCFDFKAFCFCFCLFFRNIVAHGDKFLTQSSERTCSGRVVCATHTPKQLLPKTLAVLNKCCILDGLAFKLDTQPYCPSLC